jgi:hypothetical protein
MVLEFDFFLQGSCERKRRSGDEGRRKARAAAPGWRKEVWHTRKCRRAVRAPAGALRCPQLIALLPLCSMDTLRALLGGKASDMVNSIQDAKCEDLEGRETHA